MCVWVGCVWGGGLRGESGVLRTCKRLGAIDVQLALESRRHTLQDVGFEALLILSVGRERRHRQ